MKIDHRCTQVTMLSGALHLLHKRTAQHRFYEYMTARQNLRFTARVFYERLRATIGQRVVEALDPVGLTDKAEVYDVMPWRLLIDFETNHQLAYYPANGQPLPTVTPIIASVLWCVLFTVVAIWRMSREGF